MKRVLFLGLLVGLLPSLSAAADSWPDAFSRRDYKLGMSLKEFRKAPFPDRDKDPGAFVACSNDAIADRSGYEDVKFIGERFTSAHVVKCMHYFTDQIGTMTTVYSAGLGLADQMVATSFYFIPADDKELRLFWIVTEGPSASFDSLTPIMLKAYGTPEHQVATWQNQAGNTFPNDVYTWKQGGSSIELRHFGDTVQKFSMQHRLEPLMAKFNAVAADYNAKMAKKL